MRLRGIAILVAAIAILLLIFAGLGTRIGLWNFRFGIGMLRWAAYFGIAGVVLSLITLAIARPPGSGTVDGAGHRGDRLGCGPHRGDSHHQVVRLPR
jgi:hypothetical protein